VGVIDQIRIRAGRLTSKRELNNQASRKVITTSLEKANSIVMLYKITAEEDYTKVNNFMKYLKSEFGMKRVFFLGYWDDAKEDPEFLQSKLDFDFFSKKDLNWKGIPVGGNIDNFIAEKFDILIDLNNYYNIPLRYLILKSSAKLKVGRYSKENEPFFDLMVGGNDSDFEDYCNQLVKYLTMIK
jgi:hypothetical protein